jgi:hypothetical protein
MSHDAQCCTSKLISDGGLPVKFSAMRTRAFRRHHDERIKRRVARYYSGYAAGDPRATGRLAHTRTPCSCWMCGNPRRWRHEPTLQEIRAAV